MCEAGDWRLQACEAISQLVCQRQIRKSVELICGCNERSRGNAMQGKLVQSERVAGRLTKLRLSPIQLHSCVLGRVGVAFLIYATNM